MSDTIHLKRLAVLTVVIMIMVPAASFSRENSLRGGVSVGYDYNDRNYDDGGDDDYESIVLSPMMQFSSRSERDNFELQAQPGIKYNLLDSDTDWDANLRVAADRYMTKYWLLGITNNFLRTDYQNTDSGILIDPSQEDAAPSTEPQLSSNRYRTRYWLNNLNLFSNYFYKENSSIRLGFDYAALRNDDSIVSSEDDYDRYTASITNVHRYNPRWRSTLDLQYVRGDFTPVESSTSTGSTLDPLSGDLNEYRLGLVLDNDSIVHNPLSLSYNFVDTNYDETSYSDSYIHQMRLTWRRDFSPRLYTRLGAGPSYEKTEGQDGNWSENGIAEVNYSLERGFVNFRVEKTYDVENFSGSDQNGTVDSWNSRLSGSYQLQQYLSLSGYLSYIYEDREQNVTFQSSGGGTQLATYHQDVYGAGTVLSYDFWQFYNASLAYTYTKQDSEIVGDDYDDHRILLTLSWEKELLRW